MHPSSFFEFCPKCGRAQRGDRPSRSFQCRDCGFLYYFNPAIAVAAFITDSQQRTLFIRRAKEPGQGKLAIPGGFIDTGETAEEACRREIREEVNLDVSSMEFLCSRPNRYLYRGVTYPVLDVFFVTRSLAPQEAEARDEVESVCWLDPREVDPDEIAFSSMREALQMLLNRD